MKITLNTETTPKTAYRPCMRRCVFCGEMFDANQEGVTYKNGTDAHEDCDDAEEFRRANSFELNDN